MVKVFQWKKIVVISPDKDLSMNRFREAWAGVARSIRVLGRIPYMLGLAFSDFESWPKILERDVGPMEIIGLWESRSSQ